MKKKYILTLSASLLIVVAALLILFLPKEAEEPAPSTEPDASLATVDSGTLDYAGRQVGSVVHDYLFLFASLRECNTVFTNELFEDVQYVTRNRGTDVLGTLSGIQMRLLMKELCGLSLETVNEFRVGWDPDTNGTGIRDLILHYEDGRSVEVTYSDICCYVSVLNSDGVYEPVEPGVYYALTDESQNLQDLISSYFLKLRRKRICPIPLVGR